MAEVTGLSQSQVYKWCWDQKKKYNKGKQQHCKNYHQKRKLIKKSLGYRVNEKNESESEGDEFQK